MCPITRSDTAAPAACRPGQDGVAQVRHRQPAVVDDLVAGGAGDPVDQVVAGVVAAGVLGGRVGGQVRRGRRGGGGHRVAAPGDGDGDLPGREPVRVVAGGEGELGHRLVAAFPLGGPAGEGEREEDRLPAGARLPGRRGRQR